MEFVCQDLAQDGLVLVPPSSPDYAGMLADIERRTGQAVDGSPPLPEQFRVQIRDEDRATSAILLNRSPKAIAALQAVWVFETEAGRSYRHSRGMLSAQALLLPFGRLDPTWLKIMSYWQTILPGSKRYLGESGMVGDNMDVRPPADDEKWRGGIVGGRGGGGGGSRGPIKRITLVLDGAFFLDGEFVGPDREKLFARTVADAEAHLMVGRAARDGHNNGLPASEILHEVEKVTGPAPERPPMMDIAFRNPGVTFEEFRQAALQQIAYSFALRRTNPQLPQSLDQAVYEMMSWTETALPNYRKR